MGGFSARTVESTHPSPREDERELRGLQCCNSWRIENAITIDRAPVPVPVVVPVKGVGDFYFFFPVLFVLCILKAE